MQLAATTFPHVHVRRRLSRKPLALAIAFAFGTVVMPAAHAATLTVSNTNDAGAGSLRGQIAAAVSGDTINFSVTGAITLTTGEIAFAKSLLVSGPGSGSLNLTKSGASSRIFNITGTPTVTISGLTFSGAGGPGIGGGGAITKAGGSLTIQNSVFTGNSADGGGGALYNQKGPLNIQSSVFTNNTVGAVNDGASDGGALYISTGNVTIQDSTISGNRCGNDGGGIYHSQGTLTIINSTISNNQAQYGSAISRFCGTCNLAYSNNATTITNSTITGNSIFAARVSSTQGGALFFDAATHTISNSTIANNSAPEAVGGNIQITGGAILNLRSTIVSGGTDVSGNRDIFVNTASTINSSDSLVQNPGGFLNGTVTNTITGQSPLLAALANNGGPTQTMALQGGSPAIDKGANPSALAFDQRGTPFVRSIGQTDIGAFEVQGGPPPPPPSVAQIPTLSQWGLGVMSVLMAGWALVTGFGRRRRS